MTYTLDEIIVSMQKQIDLPSGTHGSLTESAKLVANTTLSLLQELKERRESEIRPATKYLGCKLELQYHHYHHFESEMTESQQAYIDYCVGIGKIDHLIEEIIDVQMSAETLLTILGLDEQQRREARKRVIAKNAARGYYEEVV